MGVGTDDMEYMMKVTAVLLFLHLAMFGKMYGCVFLAAPLLSCKMLLTRIHCDESLILH